jgi:hypothetical protein
MEKKSFLSARNRMIARQGSSLDISTSNSPQAKGLRVKIEANGVA